MPTRRILLLVTLVVLPQYAAAQRLAIDGYIKAESIYDTRQVLQVREGQFHLYPLRDSPATSTSNFLIAAFQSRIGVTSRTENMLSGQAVARLEGDFFGTSNDNVSTLRLRHAYVEWKKGPHSVLFGQYWSPLFTIDECPQVIGFATGAPFQPFARFPQIRYAHSTELLQVEAAVSSQRDAFAEIGGSKLQHQSGLPAGHLHIEMLQSGMTLGVGGLVKSVRPSLGGSSFSATSGTAYVKWLRGPLDLRVKTVYGADLADHLMIGGFVTTSESKYKPTRLTSSWLDISFSEGVWSAGLFLGYLKNLGVAEQIPGGVASANARASDMADVWRIAPRFSLKFESLKIAAELETTSAAYGNSFDNRYRPQSVETRVVNVRGVVAAFYYF